MIYKNEYTRLQFNTMVFNGQTNFLLLPLSERVIGAPDNKNPVPVSV